jgi:hypothetical protein
MYLSHKDPYSYDLHNPVQDLEVINMNLYNTLCKVTGSGLNDRGSISSKQRDFSPGGGGILNNADQSPPSV